MRILPREQLSPSDRALLEAAEEASSRSNAELSHYCVGAALQVVRPDGGETTVVGNNYETLTFKSVCAEKHAIVRTFGDLSRVGADGVMQRPKVTAVAVFCRTGGTPQQPCGDCRQTLYEVNPDMRVLAAAGPNAEGMHDPRVSVTSLRELLPHGFELRLSGDAWQGAESGRLVEPSELAAHVVHIPKPSDLKQDAAERAALLHGIGFFLLVGSPKRARGVAEEIASGGGEVGCYCDLTEAGRDETVREFAVWVARPPGMQHRVAVVSHGIGESGVEIVLSELPALIALETGAPPTLKAVIRAGTRGTLERVPLGCVAVSTRTLNDTFDVATAHPDVLDALRRAAADLGMERVTEEALTARDPDAAWEGDPLNLVVEGAGMATRFFWRGQGRPLYRPHAAEETLRHERRNRLELLERFVQQGVRWIEMEDFAVLEIAAACGYPAATLGAVIAHRRKADGAFQVDYDKAMYLRSELVPTRLALAAFRLLEQG
jgi:uridine phosphorylase/cytidine deaminase